MLHVFQRHRAAFSRRARRIVYASITPGGLEDGYAGYARIAIVRLSWGGRFVLGTEESTGAATAEAAETGEERKEAADDGYANYDCEGSMLLLDFWATKKRTERIS